MVVSDLRTLLRSRLKSGNDTDRYPDIDLERAILIVGNDFVNRTRCVRQTDTITLVLDDDDVSLTGIANFYPELIEDIAVVESADYSASDVEAGLEVVDLQEIRSRRACSTSSDTPTLIAFNGPTAAKVHPPASAAGSLSMVWTPPFGVISSTKTILFVPSTTGTQDASVVNVPDFLLIPCIDRMVVEAQRNEGEKVPDLDGKVADYERHVRDSMGRGGLGAKVIFRSKAR